MAQLNIYEEWMTLRFGAGRFWVEGLIWLVALLALGIVMTGVKKRRPPGPTVWPIIGTMPSMRPNLLRMFLDLSHEFKSSVLYLQLGMQPAFVIHSVDAVNEICKSKDAEYANRPVTSILKTAAQELGFDNSVLALAAYTPLVKHLRKVCIAELFTVSKVAAMVKTRTELTVSLVTQMEADAIKEGTVNVSEVVESLGFLVMCRMLFGDKYSVPGLNITGFLKEIQAVVTDWEHQFSKKNIGDFIPFLKFTDLSGFKIPAREIYSRAKNVYGRLIADHRDENQKNVSPNFVDKLLALKGSDKFSDVELMGIINEMLAAGKETSAMAVEWALLELIRNPQLLLNLQNEIDSVVGQERCLEESDIPNLPYLTAVIKEALRLHPPIPLLFRSNFSPATVAGYDVPANSTIFINIWAICRDPKIWGKDSTEFVPERFMEKKMDYSGSDFQYLPFGTGRRRCLGMTSGLLVAQRTLAVIVHAFHCSPAPGLKPEDVSNEENGAVPLKPTVRLLCAVKPRPSMQLYKNLAASYQ